MLKLTTETLDMLGVVGMPFPKTDPCHEITYEGH